MSSYKLILNLYRNTIYILSVYSPFSDRVGLPPHNAPFPGVLMEQRFLNDGCPS